MPQVLPVADTYGEETAETETGKTVDLSKQFPFPVFSCESLILDRTVFY